jgi:hypothetical protein
MQGVSLDRIRVDGTLQSDFILGDKTPWEALQIGIGDPVVLKEYSMTLSAFIAINFWGAVMTDVSNRYSKFQREACSTNMGSW